jgi:putative glycosyltransferase (TIGR04372 family)
MAGLSFTRAQVHSDLLYRDIGRKPERPFTILAQTLETTLGDLISKAVFFATLKNQFDHARLRVCFRDVRPYSRKVMSLAPNFDTLDTFKGELPAWLRSRLKRDRFWRPLLVDARKGAKRNFYDLVLNDWMADSRSVHGLPNVVPLRVPPELEPRLEHRLIERGLDRSRWFAVIHYRDSGYQWRANVGGLRDSNPEAFNHLIDHVVDELGGQVVRLGHPQMQKFPERPGYVDLSRLENSFMLQAFAVSRARYFVAGPSGVAAVGWGFQVPGAVVDASDAQGGWGDMERYVLTHEVETPDRGALRNRALLDAGLLSRRPLARLIKEREGYAVRKCTGSELASVADHLHACTGDVADWRPPRQMPDAPRPNVVAWPPQTREDLTFLDI